MQGNYVAILSTSYWFEVPCNGRCLEPGPGKRGGTHRRYNPYGEPEANEELVPLTRCDTFGCGHQSTHTHDVLGEDRYDFSLTESEQSDTESEYEKELVDRDTLKEVGNVLRRGRTLAVIRTKHCQEESCQYPGQCLQRHLLHDPTRNPQEEEKCIVLWKCL